jgi:hypothetical protein
MNEESTKKSQKSAKIFHCEKCDFTCFKKSGWNRHIITSKHITQPIDKNSQPKQTQIICNCGKTYADRSGLWRHANKCENKKTQDVNMPINKDLNEGSNLNSTEKGDKEIKDLDLIQILINENRDFKNLILEIIKKDNGNFITNTNNNINFNNKTFNLNFFLNEQCKDALNINEFVDSITLQICDLETTGRLGYVEGMSRIINKNLDKLDKCKRPFHCSDLKREVIYIKNNDLWCKEESTKPVLRNVIKQVANKNINQISEWRQLNPGCTSSDSRKNDFYLKLVSNAMSGSTTEEQNNNYNKIISNILKSITIDK